MKKYIVILMTVIMAFAAAACQQPLQEDEQGSPQPGDTIVDPEPEGETVELSLYFANSEYIQTGDENLEKLLVERRKVTLTNQSPAETAMQELIKGPQQQEMSGVIPSRIDLIEVEVADNTAYVNFSSANMGGGSLEEVMLVSSVIMTLTELEDIDSVQFLVDGKKPETLMGHIYTMEPMGRNDL